MAFRWRADDDPLIMVFRSSLPSSAKKPNNKKNVKVGPPDKTFWIRASYTVWHIPFLWDVIGTCVCVCGGGGVGMLCIDIVKPLFKDIWGQNCILLKQQFNTISSVESSTCQKQTKKKGCSVLHKTSWLHAYGGLVIVQMALFTHNALYALLLGVVVLYSEHRKWYKKQSSKILGILVMTVQSQPISK